MKRLNSIDFIKVIGILTMIQIHLGMYLLHPSQKIGFYGIMNFLGKMAAPLFLFAVGINLVISINNRKKQATSHIIKRSLFLIAFGILFIIIWQPSILHFIGIFILISYLLLLFSDKIKLLTAVIFTFGSLILLKYIDYMSGWNRIAYELANFWTIKGFFTNLIVNGFYPMFPWIAFTIIGTIIGAQLLKAIKSKKEKLFAKKIFITGLILMAIGQLLTKVTSWTFNFYQTKPSFVLFFLGTSMIIFSTGFYYLDIKKKAPDFSALMNLMGSTCLSIYILHVLVGILFFRYTGTLNTLSMTGVLVWITIVIIIITLISYCFKKLLGNGPFEYVMRKFAG